MSFPRSYHASDLFSLQHFPSLNCSLTQPLWPLQQGKKIDKTNDSICIGLNNSSQLRENMLLIHSDRNLGYAAFASTFCLFLKQVLGINGEKSCSLVLQTFVRVLWLCCSRQKAASFSEVAVSFLHITTKTLFLTQGLGK